MAETVDVAVIGAGVVGCSVAYYLANRGVSVHLYEREAIGSGASAHATGSLSLLGAEFSPGPTFQLALAGYREFPSLVPELEEATAMDLLYQRRPSLRLALDEDEEVFIKSLMPWQQEHVAMRWIGGSEVRQIEPRLTERIRGAVYEEESAQLDSYRLNLALAQAAEKKGAELRIRQVEGLIVKTGRGQRPGRVTGIRTSGGVISCNYVVLAAGVWSADFGDQLDFQVPVRPLKGERLLLRYAGEPLPVLISSPKRGHMISRLDGLLSVGSTGGRDYDQHATNLGTEFDRQPTDAARMELLSRAMDVFPGLAEAELVQQLAGSRPLSPDGKPIIGPIPGWEGIYLATGHTTKGIHLGPITGRIIADHITHGSPQGPVEPADLEEFLPSRFLDVQSPDFTASGLRAEE
jgi:glycine oxidase